MDGPGLAGKVRLDSGGCGRNAVDRHVKAGMGWRGRTRSGLSRAGAAGGSGEAGPAGKSRRETARQRSGEVRQAGPAGRGLVRQGASRHGRDRQARQARLGKARHVEVGHGAASQARQAWQGTAGPGAAPVGATWTGSAVVQGPRWEGGEAGTARRGKSTGGRRGWRGLAAVRRGRQRSFDNLAEREKGCHHYVAARPPER